MHARRSLTLAVLAILLLAAPACSKPRLIDAPYVMRTEEARAFYESAPESVKTPDIPILYVTNRAVDKETPTGPRYGYKRAQEMSYGIARIGLSPEPTWETLVDDSVHGPRENRYEIRIASVKLHIIAHSRGTDVATTALREIQFEIRGLYHRSLYAPRTGREMVTSVLPDQEVYKILKLETLILAAPDMDIDVFGQRFLNEGLIHVADRIVIYTSEHDKALGLSNWLFRGRSRLGDMKLSTLNPKMIEILSQVDKLEIINCAVKSQDSHGYIFRHPAAFSDLILLMRDDLDPGPDGPRPLKRANACVWQLDNDYLKPASP